MNLGALGGVAYTGQPGDPQRPPHEPPVTPTEMAQWAHQRTTGGVPGQPVIQPIPSIGDTVHVRLQPWGPTVPATVTRVQPVDVVSHPEWFNGLVDPNLWVPLQNADGTAVVDAHGNPQYQQKWDPWPWLEVVTLPTDPGLPHELRAGIPVRCKEARVRGSAGWLWPGHPLDTPWKP